jgi:hypothetical protein
MNYKIDMIILDFVINLLYVTNIFLFYSYLLVKLDLNIKETILLIK